MSVLTTVAAFQTLHATISGVQSAPTELPASLDLDRLPLVFTWPGPSLDINGWETVGGKYSQNRRYIIRCYVAPVADKDAEVDDGYQLTLPLLQAFGVAYIQNILAKGDLGVVVHIGRITDSGAVVLEYAGVRHHGFEYQVETTEKVVP